MLPPTMLHKIKVEITRFIDDSQPGFVEYRLVDAQQHEWFFEEKVPVVTSAYLDATSAYPNQGVIACRIIGSRITNNQEIIIVDTTEPWGINSVCGKTQFEVLPDQLKEE
jgi:hypothetical protein